MKHPVPTQPNGKLRRFKSTTFDHTVGGLLHKRSYLVEAVKASRAALAAAKADIAALDRTLKLVGYDGAPPGHHAELDQPPLLQGRINGALGVRGPA